jgi:hypothetical protein
VVTAPDLFPQYSRRHSLTLEEIVLRPSEREKGQEVVMQRRTMFERLSVDVIAHGSFLDIRKGWP